MSSKPTFEPDFPWSGRIPLPHGRETHIPFGPGPVKFTNPDPRPLDDPELVPAEIDARLRATARPAARAPGALARQEGGGHYKGMKIQPVEFIHANNLGFLEGCIVKRICRWRQKDGLQDLQKIKHEIDLLIDLEGLKP